MSADASTASAKRKAGLLLILLSLGYFLAYFDRLLMTVVGEMVKSEFQLSDKQLSLLNGAAFTLIYGLCGIPMGWLGDRFSRKKIIAWSLAAWSVLTAACGAAQSFAQLAIARAGVGVGESGLVPVANSLIADTYPPAKRPLAIAIFFAGGLIGILVCFLAGTWVASHYGWRAAFLVAGPPGLILAVVVALYAKEPPRETVLSGSSASDAPTVGLVWRNRALRWLLLGGAVSTYINIGIVQWLPNFFIRSHGLTLAEIGLFFGPVLSLGMTVGMLAGGWIGNRIAAVSLTRLIWMSAAVLVAVVPCYLLIFWSPSLPVALGATFVGTALSVLYSAPFSAAWQSLCDPRARGTAAGLASFANSMVGGALCSYLVGMLSDYWAPTLGRESLRQALIVSMLICLVAALMFAYSARLATQAQKAHG